MGPFFSFKRRATSSSSSKSEDGHLITDFFYWPSLSLLRKRERDFNKEKTGWHEQIDLATTDTLSQRPTKPLVPQSRTPNIRGENIPKIISNFIPVIVRGPHHQGRKNSVRYTHRYRSNCQTRRPSTIRWISVWAPLAWPKTTGKMFPHRSKKLARLTTSVSIHSRSPPDHQQTLRHASIHHQKKNISLKGHQREFIQTSDLTLEHLSKIIIFTICRSSENYLTKATPISYSLLTQIKKICRSGWRCNTDDDRVATHQSTRTHHLGFWKYIYIYIESWENDNDECVLLGSNSFIYPVISFTKREQAPYGSSQSNTDKSMCLF